ncbi:MAG: hypothetical protein E6J22_16690 [Chloroflexi bacterium]|nr:MAG: hypothetical protein E6J22_16690 [Chloroflexota bacterium]
MSTPPLHSGLRQWKLAGAIISNARLLDVLMSVTYFAIGFSPITALAIAIMGLLPLSITTLSLVLPATMLGVALALLFPRYGKLALQGLIIGLIAVFLYDCMRVPFILAGVWGDFIPKINMWLFNTSHPNWIVGYVWRYLGDGGFMGMAFTVGYGVLKPRVNSRLAGLAFGIAIWGCLMLTLLLAPHGQEMLFKLTLTTLSLSLLGHIIYGLALGILFPYVSRESTIGTEPPQTAIDLSHYTVGADLSRPWPIDRPSLDVEATIKLPRNRRNMQIWEQQTAPLPAS